MMTAGRPSLYNDELAEKICDLVATTEDGLTELCSKHDWLPDESTIRLWRFKHAKFSLQYIQAKKFQAELLAEGTLAIAKVKPTYHDSDGNERVDAGHVAWQKLNINTRQWHASKLAPKIYGDKLQTEHSVSDSTKEVVKRVADINKENEKAF